MRALQLREKHCCCDARHYDAVGDQVEQDEWKSSGGGVVTTRHAYDDQNNAWADVNSSNAVVGRLAPARPSATRAGVSSRRSIIERSGGAGVFMSVYSAGTDTSRSRSE